MYNETYEILCLITSSIITVSSAYIFIIDDKPLFIFITLSGFTSFSTRFYRIMKEEYIMDHPLVYTDILFAIIAFLAFIYDPLDVQINYLIVSAFILMVIAAIMSWSIFPVKLVQESFYFQFTGHLIVSYSLVYYIAQINK